MVTSSAGEAHPRTWKLLPVPKARDERTVRTPAHMCMPISPRVTTDIRCAGVLCAGRVPPRFSLRLFSRTAMPHCNDRGLRGACMPCVPRCARRGLTTLPRVV